MKKQLYWRIFKTIWFSLALIFLAWNITTFQSRNLPPDTFINSEQVIVTETDNLYLFKPTRAARNFEIIFFQGGLTDPKAYAPLCKKLAQNGYTCHLLKMSWRLPQKDYRKVLKLLNIKGGHYVIGGHSQGGKMAAQLVFENPTLFKGLFLLGTSHPRDIDLSTLLLPTVKIYAEHDGLASVNEVVRNKGKLPQKTQFVLLNGANHSQFGY